MRTTFISLLLTCSLGLTAQDYRDSTATDSGHRYRRDSLYVQLFGGINKSANENLPFSELSGYPLSVGAFLAVGRELTPLWGWRAALRVDHNKSRNVARCEYDETWGWNNTSLFGDATFDLTDAFRGRRGTDSVAPRFNLKAFAGIGAAYTWGFDQVPLSYTHPYSRTSRLLPAGRLGLTATWRLKGRWRIGAELSHTLYEDHFNGVAHATPIDGRTNLKVGLAYMFGKRRQHIGKRPVQRSTRLRESPQLPFIMPDPEGTKLRQLQGHAFLDFPVNETVIYPNYRRNPQELARIQRSVDSVLFDKSVSIKRILLHGYASPESPYDNNTRLANGRTEAMKNYLIRRYNFQADLFATDYTPEDWDNLRGFLNNTQGRRVKGDFWYDNKAYAETPQVPAAVTKHRDELLAVIDLDTDPDDKEQRLKAVGDGKPYQWLLQHVFPGLRHTDYIIEYEVQAYAPTKSRRLIYTHPEALSLEEMYLVAQSYEEGSDNWFDALIIAVRQFPDDPKANLNAACACVKTRRLIDARRYLRKAGTLREARYVADVIRAMEGSAKWHMEYGRVVIDED